MATIMKVLYDDHARITRLFNKAKQSPSLEMALAVCEELEMHSVMEDELVYPRIEEVAPDTAQEAEEAHGRMKEIVGEIEKMEPMNPGLKTTIERLEKVVLRHVDFEEREIFPILKNRFNDEVDELGREAFALRQDLLAELPQRKPSSGVDANTGWSSRVTNAGW